VAESMYLGQPVISTNWSATAEFVDDTNGCPVRPGSSPSNKITARMPRAPCGRIRIQYMRQNTCAGFLPIGTGRAALARRLA